MSETTQAISARQRAAQGGWRGLETATEKGATADTQKRATLAPNNGAPGGRRQVPAAVCPAYPWPAPPPFCSRPFRLALSR